MRTGSAGMGNLGVQALQQRQREAGGLAGAGLSAGKNVASSRMTGMACACTGVGSV